MLEGCTSKNKTGLHKAGSLSRSAWRLFARAGDIVEIIVYCGSQELLGSEAHWQ